jgi:hypothetical protein
MLPPSTYYMRSDIGSVPIWFNVAVDEDFLNQMGVTTKDGGEQNGD